MQNETIVVIAERRWNSLWRNTQHIMSRFARKNRVLFFEPGRDPDRPHLPELWRNLPNLVRVEVCEAQPQVFAIPTPPRFPLLRRQLPAFARPGATPLLVALNARLIAHHVRRTLRLLHVEQPILWLEDGFPWITGHVGEKLAVYHNHDDYFDFVHNSPIRDAQRALDERLVREVDLVITTSHAQAARRRPINRATYCVPNAVDFALFNRALSEALPLPDDMRGLPGPIIGFAGWLGFHIDVVLLCRIAERFPHCSLVLVGPDDLPQTPERKRLGALPNVHFLGRKPLAELPAYLRHFDAALMPWLVEVGHVKTAYPLKLHEYLAAGRAAVAVPLPELAPFRDVVRIAQNHEQFLEHVAAALGDNGADAVTARVAVARENTWDHRFALTEQLLDQHLAAKTLTTAQHNQASDMLLAHSDRSLS